MTERNLPTRISTSRAVVFWSTVLVLLLTWINPIWPYEQALHDSLAVVGLVALWFYAKKYPISNRNFLLLCIFLIAHCIAARWIYSYVPYDQWMIDLFGWSPKAAFGFTRNHFDRLVHFLYGFCFTPFLAEYCAEKYGQNATRSFVLAIAFVIISSVCYEWFEWLLAVVMSPHDVEAYNGQQGDMWDAHKDMLLATVGSLIWYPWRRRL